MFLSHTEICCCLFSVAFIHILLGSYLCMPMIYKPQNWTYFVFAQQWPPAACLEVPHGKCKIPEGVDDWSIHGLWPTSDKGYPSFCNNSWPFNPASLKSILKELEVKWPNIYAHSSQNVFWKHEWLKHGTCAASLPEFDTELKYFSRSLQLHDSFDIYTFLSKAGISPNETLPVPLKYVEKAITSFVNKTVKLFCNNHDEFDFPILTSMYVCLDKSEQVIDCDKIHERACNETQILYLPFNNTVSKKMWYY